ncbi:hypothetical protein BBF96_14840 [Anoxybacter fermentans]|uniref:Cob(I)yrinic acid a,c-diamide adenosyltransferase n=1 Tax=Anoxybacter fermentans TaxID=1323375 RepID=A0A3S9T1W8_9FIRM|nr:cob(I)yrinic acid a,c-diamide adenosyltransferase [Anoxybacter fermentans]AZR74551.1 hypothetical protein BBF96_14840 [Anoxybacter fermentans]
MTRGLVHIYTGDGKGKTTAALGLAFRAIGYGMRVKVIQFLKGGYSGEFKTVSLLKPWIEIEIINHFKKRIFKLTEDEWKKLAQLTEEAVASLLISLKKGEYDIYILDEIFGALKRDLITVEKIREIIKNKAEKVELVLTGRGAPYELKQMADYVTVMQKEAHPFDKQIGARRGIEY